MFPLYEAAKVVKLTEAESKMVVVRLGEGKMGVFVPWA